MHNVCINISRHACISFLGELLLSAHPWQKSKNVSSEHLRKGSELYGFFVTVYGANTDSGIMQADLSY